jgi:hypothetical protein
VKSGSNSVPGRVELSGNSGGRPGRLPHALRGGRHIDMADTEL